MVRFQWEVLYEGKSREELNKMEAYYIREWNSHICKGGYNMTWGG